MPIPRSAVAAIPGLAAVVAIAGGSLVLVGWLLDIDLLKQPVSGVGSMKANNAAACAVGGLSLWLLSRRHQTRAAAALAAFVAAVGALSLIQHLSGWDLGLDEVLFRDDTSTGGAPPGRMSPLSAGTHVLLGSALLASAVRSRAWSSQALALGACVVSATGLLGHLFELQALYSIGTTSTQGIHTALLLIALAIGILALDPERGLLGLIAGDGSAARIGRRVLPIGIVVPIVVGWMSRVGEHSSWFGDDMGDALVVVATVVLLSAAIWVSTAALNRVDARRREAEVALQHANEVLEARVAEQTDAVRRKEQEAAANAALFYHLFDQAPDAIVCVNPDRVIVRFNAKAEEMSGYRAEDVIGLPADVLLGDEQAAWFRRDWPLYLQLTSPANVEAVGRRKDGREFPTEVMFSPTQGPTGLLIVAVVRDISARKQMEDALRAANERLEAGKRLEAISQLAGGAAHDFNNMMTVVTGYSELLLSRMSDDDPHRSAVQEIRRTGARGAALTRQLLAFSRRQVLSPTVLDLKTLVDDLCPMLPILLGDAIQVDHVPGPDLWHVRADSTQIEQAIVNIAMNARDAMPHGGTLSIATTNVVVLDRAGPAPGEVAPGAYVQLAISDTGIGMDEATRTRAFEPFFTTKPVGQGTGLGLSSVYGVVKQSGGYIELESTPGAGTTLRIYLPRVQEPLSVEPQAEASAPARGWETVLLVDDDEAVRHLLREVLSGAGYQVLEAASGHEALRVCETYPEPVDLVIADVLMPGVGGVELLKQLEASGRRRCALLTSGDVASGSQDAAREVGAAFLAKPFTPAQLLQRVREILAQGAGEEIHD